MPHTCRIAELRSSPIARAGSSYGIRSWQRVGAFGGKEALAEQRQKGVAVLGGCVSEQAVDEGFESFTLFVGHGDNSGLFDSVGSGNGESERVEAFVVPCSSIEVQRFESAKG